MRVLVTGGLGFIGRHVATELTVGGHVVTVADIAEGEPVPGADYIRADLTDATQLAAAVLGHEVVCHIGAIGDVYLAAEKPALAAAVNVLGTANLLQAALEAGIKKVVYASTWEVYGRPSYEPVDENHPCFPDHPYNITKLAGDQLCQSYHHLKGLDVTVLRLGTAYGGGMRHSAVLPAFIRRALNGEPIIIQGAGTSFRQFTHARDIARAFSMVLRAPTKSHVFNIVAAEKVTIEQLANLVASKIPAKVVRGPARPGDAFPAVISSALAQRELGWTPLIDFATGAEELISSFVSASRAN